MIVNEKSQVKQTGSWEQIKCRLNKNLFKKNYHCSASISWSECGGISSSDDELKSHEALFKS